MSSNARIRAGLRKKTLWRKKRAIVVLLLLLLVVIVLVVAFQRVRIEVVSSDEDEEKAEGAGARVALPCDPSSSEELKHQQQEPKTVVFAYCCAR